VLIVVLAALGFYVVELLLFMRAARRQERLESAARARLDAMTTEIAALRERLDDFQAALDGIRRVPQTSGQYREAVEMAERGLDASSVADNCGISRAEAELIIALYRSRAA
jgi:hypothetical protein